MKTLSDNALAAIKVLLKNGFTPDGAAQAVRADVADLYADPRLNIQRPKTRLEVVSDTIAAFRTHRSVPLTAQVLSMSEADVDAIVENNLECLAIKQSAGDAIIFNGAGGTGKTYATNTRKPRRFASRSDAEIDEVVARYKRGDTLSAICRHFKYGGDAMVYSALAKRGVKPNRPRVAPKRSSDVIVQSYRNKSGRKVRAHLRPKYVPLTPETTEVAIRMYKDEAPLPDIIKATGAAGYAIYDMLRERKLTRSFEEGRTIARRKRAERALKRASEHAAANPKLV